MTSLHWQKLLKYYGLCISAENAGNVILKPQSEGKEFIRMPVAENEWLASGKEVMSAGTQSDRIRRFTLSTQWQRSTPSYFYGFPCYAKNISRTGSSWSGELQPILIFGVDYVKTNNAHTFALQGEKPRINAAFLADKSLWTSSEQRKRIAAALIDSWDSQLGRWHNTKTVLEVIARLLPHDASLSGDISDILNGGTTPRLKEGDSISPMGVIFRITDSTYTRGLENELRKLQKTATPNDVWRVILERDTQIKEDNSKNLVEITELNDEQRSAVASAFDNTVSVITGPPGTGKSQVVLNIIANALLRNQSVLFGSKNHKAVDVVIERLLRSQKEPVILKYGQRERELEFADKILAAVERASTYNRQRLESEISGHEAEIKLIHEREERATAALLRILERRNRISQLDGELDSLKSEMPLSISSNFSKHQKVTLTSEFDNSLAALLKALNEVDRGASLVSYILTIFGYTPERRALTRANTMLPLVPIANFNMPLESIHNCRELLDICQVIKRWVNLQLEFLQLVRGNEDETSIETLRKRISNSKERAVNTSVQYIDALMRRRLCSLNPADRKDIAEYVGIVRKLNSSVVSDEQAQKLRKRRNQIFKSVAKAFPTIAVTNLSVQHALPLRAGAVDITIIDEASQCDIASALPLLYRSKRAVVIGDPHQLKHISSLQSADDEQLGSQAGLDPTDDIRFTYQSNSLFELARSVVGNGAKFVHLLEHYRSHARIIGFSNRKFYENQLSVWTDYRKLLDTGSKNSLIWHNVVGESVRPTSGSLYNQYEAEQVVRLAGKLIAELYGRHGNFDVSLGIVTPFRAQANKIGTLAESNLNAAQLRKLDFIADTVHKYQGDERDIMIFSPVVSQKVRSSSLIFLQNSAEIFNVAITRARAELHVVGDKLACANSEVSHLSDFVRYVDEEEADGADIRGGRFESEWEQVLSEALSKAGINTIPQYPVHQYRLDLAIVNSDRQIAIEVDGEQWHRDIDGGQLLSDIKRDQKLEAHGWKVKRFWVYQIQQDVNKCVQEVKELLNAV